MLYEIEFPLDTLSPETVESVLFEAGASSITFADAGDEPVLEPKPGEVRLWSATCVRALFDASTDVLLATATLGARLGPHLTATARVRAVEERDWVRVAVQDLAPMRFGRRLWVCPTSAALPADPEAIVVRLDPGLAFGTGAHPTTALCLQMLEACSVEGSTIIDYGCGSGILGIAALKLGAARVVAIDIDPQALSATAANAARNGVAERIVACSPPEPREPREQREPAALPRADLILANILAQPLVELAPRLTELCRAGGELLLSGVLRSQVHEIKAAYGSAFDIVQVVHREDWSAIHAQRRADRRTGS